MGEYYYPSVIAKAENGEETMNWFYSHGYKRRYTHNGESYTIGEGLKMMEHAYFGGDMMTHVLDEVVAHCQNKEETRVVWISDYAMDLSPSDINDEGVIHAIELAQSTHPSVGENMPAIAPRLKDTATFEDGSVLYNASRKEYITIYKHRIEGESICPLPLLTQFNEGGGGNYYGLNQDLLGTWAGEKLEWSETAPEGYICLDGVFSEEA